MDGIDTTIARQHDQKPSVRDIEMTSKIPGDEWNYDLTFDSTSIWVRQFGDEGPAEAAMSIGFADFERMIVEYQKFKALRERVRGGE